MVPIPIPAHISVSTGTPTNLTVDTGTIVTMYCPVTGDNPIIDWLKDDVTFSDGDHDRIMISTTTLPGADFTSVVTIDGFQPSDSGTYQCMAANTVGADIGEVTVKVEER